MPYSSSSEWGAIAEGSLPTLMSVVGAATEITPKRTGDLSPIRDKIGSLVRHSRARVEVWIEI